MPKLHICLTRTRELEASQCHGTLAPTLQPWDDGAVLSDRGICCPQAAGVLPSHLGLGSGSHGGRGSGTSPHTVLGSETHPAPQPRAEGRVVVHVFVVKQFVKDKHEVFNLLLQTFTFSCYFYLHSLCRSCWCFRVFSSLKQNVRLQF